VKPNHRYRTRFIDDLIHADAEYWFDVDRPRKGRPFHRLAATTADKAAGVNSVMDLLPTIPKGTAAATKTNK
jgi:hypothetical protein